MADKPSNVDGKTYYNRDIRSKLRTGDLLLFRGGGFFSHVIESVEGGEYSHSAFVVRWQRRAMVVQAEYPRLEAVPLSVAVEKYSGRVDYFKIKDDAYRNLNTRKLTVEATDLLGKPFAVTDLIRVGFLNLFHRPIKKEREPDQALFCSEYVAHCFFAAGAPLAEGTNHHAVTPDQVSKSAMHENKGPIHWDPEDREAALKLGIESND